MREHAASNFHVDGASTEIDVRIMTMKVLLFSALAVLVMTWTLMRGPKSVHADARTPVLVELFTSEGCSSCPPADRFLEKLDRQPVAGAEMIVLSEHVDYWNHIGWKDPYSARVYSERQSAYAKRFGLDSVYTPQMVVDGSSEFVGSDSGLAGKAFSKALGIPKIPVHLSVIPAEASKTLHARLETGTLQASLGPPEAEVYVALALNRAESQVSAGENAGHKLAHVSVARRLVKVGTLKQGQGLSQNVRMELEPGSDLRNLRLIAFVQEPRQGRILGAASIRLDVQ
jgi:hypothetical protein